MHLDAELVDARELLMLAMLALVRQPHGEP
jgi:hypothetical protein